MLTTFAGTRKLFYYILLYSIIFYYNGVSINDAAFATNCRFSKTDYSHLKEIMFSDSWSEDRRCRAKQVSIKLNLLGRPIWLPALQKRERIVEVKTKQPWVLSDHRRGGNVENIVVCFFRNVLLSLGQ